ncbi:MAG: hypothetical protein IKH56_04145 [Oscillospiraceae bacterium]|nr:hypothetical protein [Oscillospiraceae bacterium]
MLFHSKFERARRRQREMLGLDDPDRQTQEERKPARLEKGDRFAMIMSAFLTLFLPSVLILLFLGGIFLLLIRLL